MDQIDQNNMKPNVWWQLKCDFTVVTTSPPPLFTVTTDLNVESSRTFGGSKKRATFNTDLSPLEKYFKWAVYAKFLGKKWSWVRLLWRLRGSASGREWTGIATQELTQTKVDQLG